MRRETKIALVLGAVGLGAGALALLLTRGGKVGRRFAGREHMGNVVPELYRLADRWDDVGTHAVRVPSPQETAALGLPPAGAREGAAAAALQAQAYASGSSGARTLEDTPHGAGPGFAAAAIDVWPAGFNPRVPWERQPREIVQAFEAFGAFAEREGFVWGGRWRSSRFPNGDQPHVELHNWRARRALAKGTA